MISNLLTITYPIFKIIWSALVSSNLIIFGIADSNLRAVFPALNLQVLVSEVDENYQGNTIKVLRDPLHIYGDSIIRFRAKKMQVALNGLIEKMWNENAIQDARHHELGLERREDKTLLALFKLLGSQIHNLDPMQKWKIRNKNGIY